MELVGKISKGSKMDQVYIPKNRNGFSIGTYVVLKPIDTKKSVEKLYFYDIRYIEPLKIQIINEIIAIIDKIADNYENIIITGSFLEEGFNFNDIDIILISENKLNEKYLRKTIENKIKIKVHLIILNNKELKKGLETDPLYNLMLSRCITKKRFIYKVKPKIDHKILDLHLLKSELLPINFNSLTGNEKYYLTRNMVSILMFIQNKKLTKESVDKEITELFNIKINEIKNNIIEDKKEFIKKYKSIYNKTFKKLMEGIKNASK